MTAAMTSGQAGGVYDVLIEHAHAAGWMREDFVYHLSAAGTREYRFQGGLGAGGKFWNDNGRWYVSAYPEDLCAYPNLQKIVDITNTALAALRIALNAA